MNINLYNSTAEKTRVDKTDYLTSLLSFRGTLRAATSILNPVIMIDFTNVKELEQVINTEEIDVINSNDEDVVIYATKLLFESNYAYIPEFKRYYFIEDIVAINKRLWEVRLNVDVLMSYNAQIRSLKAFITRNENEYNEYLVDSRYPLESIKKTTDSKIVATKPYQVEFRPDLYEDRIKFIITTSRYELLSAYDDAWITTDSDVITPVNLMNVPSANQYKMRLIDYENVYKLMIWMLNNPAHAKYDDIISIMLYPFNMEEEVIGNEELVYIDGVATSAKCYNFTQRHLICNEVAEFTLQPRFNDTFLDYDPFTKYELYLPYKGWIDLNPTGLMNHKIMVSYILTPSNGNCSVIVTDETTKRLIYTDSCQLGINISLLQNNERELQDQRLSMVTNTILGTLSSAVSIALGGPMGVAGGVLNLGKTAATAITTLATQHQKSTATIPSGELGQFSPQQVILRTTYPVKILEDDSEYLKLNGKPLEATKDLSTMIGYTEIGSVHVENIPNATSTELDNLEYLLKGGVIL